MSALFAGLARSPAPPSRRFETRLATKKWVRRAALEAALSTRAYLEPQPVGCAWRNLHMEADFRCEGINLGAAGILLGLMSIDRALHTNRFGNDILGGAAWLADRPPSDEAMGLFSGNAGVALALACVARRFGATGLEDKVRARLRAGPPEMQENDLFAGAAGALWAGCLIANVLQAEWPLEAGERHARWLLDSVQEIDGIICWPPSPGLGEEHPYTGAAHGSAGNAMALAAWGKRTKCSRSLSLAREIFANLHDRSRTEDGSDFRPDVGGEAPAAMARNWCHGTAGYLWCLLQAFGDDPDFHTQVDWAVEVLAPAPSLGNPTYCHGLAGFLELWRMIRTIPRHEGVARRRIRSTAAALRLLGERTSGRFLWCSEDPRTHTPDLWVGFLAPATALALHAEERPDALLSPTWLAEIARRAPDPTCPGSGRDARPGPR